MCWSELCSACADCGRAAWLQAAQLALLSTEQLQHATSYSSLVAGAAHPLGHLAAVRSAGLHGLMSSRALCVGTKFKELGSRRGAP